MISDVGGARPSAVPAGTTIAAVRIVTYERDATGGQLRRLTGARLFTVGIALADLRFGDFDGGLAVIPLETMVDGPFRGAGPAMFDEDLLRVRSVGVSLRLETGEVGLRGADPALFARPGSANVRRMLPDVATSFHVALRNP